VADSKVLKDLLPDGGGEKVEFSVMVIGGAAAIVKDKGAPSTEEIEIDIEPTLPATGISGREMLATEEFWGDLKGFLLQRLKDEKEAERVWGLFRGSV
jgi:hypothetical protein